MPLGKLKRVARILSGVYRTGGEQLKRRRIAEQAGDEEIAKLAKLYHRDLGVRAMIGCRLDGKISEETLRRAAFGRQAREELDGKGYNVSYVDIGPGAARRTMRRDGSRWRFSLY